MISKLMVSQIYRQPFNSKCIIKLAAHCLVQHARWYKELHTRHHIVVTMRALRDEVMCFYIQMPINISLCTGIYVCAYYISIIQHTLIFTVSLIHSDVLLHTLTLLKIQYHGKREILLYKNRLLLSGRPSVTRMNIWRIIQLGFSDFFSFSMHLLCHNKCQVKV